MVIDNKSKTYPQSGAGEPLARSYHKLLHDGGKPAWERCDCSAPIKHDSNGSYKDSDSCFHTFRWLTHKMQENGWSLDDVRKFADDSTCYGFSWLQAREDAEAVLTARWAQLEARPPKEARRAAKQAYNAEKATKPTYKRVKDSNDKWLSVETFTCEPGGIRKLMRTVDRNPGIWTVDLRAKMAEQGWKHGITDAYITECIARGILDAVPVQTGKRGRPPVAHTVANTEHARWWAGRHKLPTAICGPAQLSKLGPSSASNSAEVPTQTDSDSSISGDYVTGIKCIGINSEKSTQQADTEGACIGTNSATDDEHLADVVHLPKPAPAEPTEPGQYVLRRGKWKPLQDEPEPIKWQYTEDTEELDENGFVIPWWKTQEKFSEEEVTFSTERAWSSAWSI